MRCIAANELVECNESRKKNPLVYGLDEVSLAIRSRDLGASEFIRKVSRGFVPS